MDKETADKIKEQAAKDTSQWRYGKSKYEIGQAVWLGTAYEGTVVRVKIKAVHLFPDCSCLYEVDSSMTGGAPVQENLVFSSRDKAEQFVERYHADALIQFATRQEVQQDGGPKILLPE